MKLYLIGHEYHYAVEQMMFTLLAGQRPEYSTLSPEDGENALFSTLSQTDGHASVSTRLLWQGKEYFGETHFDTRADWDKIQTDRAAQREIKLSFYQAAVEALGTAPAWGALTGVRPVKLPTRHLQNGGDFSSACAQLEQEYHVSPLRASLATQCAQCSVDLQKSLTDDDVSLYVGIPFCPTRCTYCSFVSASVTRTLKLVPPFVELLCEEVKKTGEMLKQAGKTISTLYMGGGTPTTLSAPQLDHLLTVMETYLPIQDGAEFTVEAGRPDTITR